MTSSPQPVRARKETDGTTLVGTFVKLDGHPGCVVYGIDLATFEKFVGGDGASIGDADLPIDGYQTVADAFRDGWRLEDS